MSTLSAPRTRQTRRRHSPAFKAQIVTSCRQPGISVSRIALDHGLNANMVRRWMREMEPASAEVTPAFVPVNLPAAPAKDTPALSHQAIRISIPHAAGAVVVEWPAEQADQCLALLRPLLT